MLTITFPDYDERSPQSFADDVDKILIGRDPQTCQVVYAADCVAVGREHCALVRRPGGYALSLGGKYMVTRDGERLADGATIDANCTLQIGPNGPLISLAIGGENVLPATVQQGEEAPGLPTMVRQAKARSNRAVMVGVFAVLLLIIAAFVVVPMLQKTSSDVDAIKQEGAARDEMLAELSDDAIRLGEEFRQLPAPHDPAKLQRVLLDARESVYLVMLKDAAGNEQGVGTAWVVAPQRLATNAHVAKSFTDMPEGHTLWVRSCADAHETVQVQAAQIHPGFDRFEQVWTAFHPIDGASEVASAGAACDVAILQVADNAQLAKPLTLATSDEALALEPGIEVGYVGYPMENLALGGMPLSSPNPQVQRGYVTAVTDWFGRKSMGNNIGAQLVQHNLPSTGGASGSPVLDAEGRVVGLISAGNFAHLMGQRIPVATGINFAQRVDVLIEFMDGRFDDGSDTAVTELAANWQQGLDETFTSSREAMCQGVVQQWNEHLGEGVVPQLVRQESVTLEPQPAQNIALFEREMQLEAGNYLFIAVADQIDIDAIVVDLGRREKLAEDRSKDCIPVGMFELKKNTALSFGVWHANTAPEELVSEIFLYRAVAK